MKISFFGAAKTVTGSSFLVETENSRFLIDCGMFQGEQVEQLNLEFKFDPASIDFVFLTHAHLDHSGLLPKLYAEGFKGKIYATQPTQDIIEPLLLDSAKIQELEAQRYGEIMLYDSADVDQLIGNREVLNVSEWIDIRDIKVKPVRAGHILGAVSFIIDDGKNKVIFSGDLGRRDQSIINTYDLIDEEVDYVVMESLYGGQMHEDRGLSVKKLLDEIHETINNGNIIIPVFAIHRSQEILLELKNFYNNGQLDSLNKVYLDGPLSLKITQIYTNYLRAANEHFALNPEFGELFGDGFYDFEKLKLIRENKESMRVMRSRSRIALAGNGMCAGGRVMNHLYNGLKKPNVKVILVGYQADGTLGRELVDGKRRVKIKNKEIDVRAKIVQLHGFSGHADHKDLIKWVENKVSPRLKKIFLIHADEDRSRAFGRKLDEMNLSYHIPDLYETVEI